MVVAGEVGDVVDGLLVDDNGRRDDAMDLDDGGTDGGGQESGGETVAFRERGKMQGG